MGNHANVIVHFTTGKYSFFPAYISPLGWGKNGNTNWVEFGTPLLRFQPSELAKLALVIWAADVLDRKYKLLSQPKHLVFPFRRYQIQPAWRGERS